MNAKHRRGVIFGHFSQKGIQFSCSDHQRTFHRIGNRDMANGSERACESHSAGDLWTFACQTSSSFQYELWHEIAIKRHADPTTGMFTSGLPFGWWLCVYFVVHPLCFAQASNAVITGDGSNECRLRVSGKEPGHLVVHSPTLPHRYLRRPNLIPIHLNIQHPISMIATTNQPNRTDDFLF